MSKEKTSSTESPEDLKKALDDNLAAIEENLKKSKGKDDEDLKEMMKDKGTRKKLKEALSEYDDEDDEDEEGEDKGRERMGDDGDDDEDDQEEAPKGKSKMRKSIESLVDADEEIIDAVPVLKSFLSIVSKQAEVIEDLSAQVQDLRKSFTEGLELQKSIAAGVKSEGALLKSLADEIDSFGEEVPATPKGKLTPEGSTLEKSFRDKEGNVKTYHVPTVQQILMKSFQETGNQALQKEISKWELSRYNMNMLSPATLAMVDRNLKAGGDN